MFNFGSTRNLAIKNLSSNLTNIIMYNLNITKTHPQSPFTFRTLLSTVVRLWHILFEMYFLLCYAPMLLKTKFNAFPDFNLCWNYPYYWYDIIEILNPIYLKINLYNTISFRFCSNITIGITTRTRLHLSSSATSSQSTCSPAIEHTTYTIALYVVARRAYNFRHLQNWFLKKWFHVMFK